MDIKDILSVGLTTEDFDLLAEGLEALPEKGLAQELAMGMLEMICVPEQRRKEAQQSITTRMKALEKKIHSRSDDLTILKSKLILLKRLLAGNQAIEEVKIILDPPPRNKQLITIHLAA